MKSLYKLAFCITFLTLAPVTAGSSYARAERVAKHALMIGISDYQNLDHLDNPGNDVEHVAAKLQSAGFDVTVIRDSQASRKGILDTFRLFAKGVRPGDAVVVYYAGHGLALNDDNLIAPYDSPKPTEVVNRADLQQQLLPVRPLLEELNDRDPAIQIWIVDACRVDPYAGGGRDYVGPAGLTNANYLLGNSYYIVYTAGYNQVAADGLPTDAPKSGLGSPYSRTFVELFDSWKGRSVVDFAHAVRDRVADLVKPRLQRGDIDDQIRGQWCFDVCAEQLAAVTVTTPARHGGKQTTTQAASAYLADGSSPQQASTTEPGYTPNMGSATMPAVFLGKKSARACNDVTVSDRYPFGCAILKQLAAGAAVHAVVALTPVNIRNGPPSVVDGKASYGCKSRLVKTKERLVLKRTLALHYLEDTFYWGVVSGEDGNCT